MPLSSMTGFGQAEVSAPSGTYHVEIRSVNNRFLEIQTRMPRSFSNLEQKIKKLLSDKVARGSIAVYIVWKHGEKADVLKWDKTAVNSYITIFREIKKQYNLKQEVNLSNLLAFSDFIKKETAEYNDDTIWGHLKPALQAALKDFLASRKREGAYIVSDLRKMVKSISENLIKVERRAPVRLKKYTTDLKKKIKNFVGRDMDPSRMAMEIALIADKQDIAEECTRLAAHIEKLQANFNSSEPAGKRFGFILQEMNREANTIGSKANDIKISHLSVALKESIEKIREQVMNIE